MADLLSLPTSLTGVSGIKSWLGLWCRLSINADAERQWQWFVWLAWVLDTQLWPCSDLTIVNTYEVKQRLGALTLSHNQSFLKAYTKWSWNKNCCAVTLVTIYLITVHYWTLNMSKKCWKTGNRRFSVYLSAHWKSVYYCSFPGKSVCRKRHN